LFQKIHILILLSLIFALRPLSAQNGDRICIGATAMYKATGEAGSTFEYDIPADVQLITEYSDSVVVKWGKKGIFNLGVQEISQNGCYGDWEYLEVNVVGTEIDFSAEQYSLCDGESVQIEFNRTDFQAYQFRGNEVTSDGLVTKPGVYELTVVDRDNCRTSAFITVEESPRPRVNLGRDTMICSSEFRLFALKDDVNPVGTTYQWSTDESGTVPFIDFTGFNTDKGATVWVMANLNGCTASDTIIIYPCIESLKIPNTFTPNGDGINDDWQITVLSNFPDAIVEVFDRWARKVFTSTKGYTQPWNGRDTKGHILPMETYYYIINLNDARNSKPITGIVTIIH
jgi:gliding motility-associated-like protein